VPGPRDDVLPGRGTPLYWQTGAGAAAPSVVLTAERERQLKRTVGGSLLLVVLLLTAWALAQLPGVLAWVRAFWPEELALLGCLGWQTYGPALPLIALIVLGVAARALFLGQRLLAVLNRPRPAGAAPLAAEPRPSGSGT
jgi:hypothetical protein